MRIFIHSYSIKYFFSRGIQIIRNYSLTEDDLFLTYNLFNKFLKTDDRFHDSEVISLGKYESIEIFKNKNLPLLSYAFHSLSNLYVDPAEESETINTNANKPANIANHNECTTPDPDPDPDHHVNIETTSPLLAPTEQRQSETEAPATASNKDKPLSQEATRGGRFASKLKKLGPFGDFLGQCLTLLRQPSYLLLLFTHGFFVSANIFVSAVALVSYMKTELHYEPTQASTLYMAFAIGDFFGRLLTGCLIVSPLLEGWLFRKHPSSRSRYYFRRVGRVLNVQLIYFVVGWIELLAITSLFLLGHLLRVVHLFVVVLVLLGFGAGGTTCQFPVYLAEIVGVSRILFNI